VVFDTASGWIAGGNQNAWGAGTCGVTTGKAPSNRPLKDSDTPVKLTTQSIFHIDTQNTGYQGCGQFYPGYLDLEGAKEIRFWISSTAQALVEVQVDQPCVPFRGDADSTGGRDPCKTQLTIAPTGAGEWLSFGIPLTDRRLNEFSNTLSPFMITVVADGTVSIANIVAVY